VDPGEDRGAGLSPGAPTVAVDLAVSELPPLPAAMEVAAFRIVTEAVTNAVRHAAASTCRVTLEVTGRLLVVGQRRRSRLWHRAGGVDVVLMDLNPPSLSGVQATARIAALPDPTAVLVVTMVADDGTVVAAMRAGARGYVLKDATGDQIAAAVRTLAAGGEVFSGGVAAHMLALTSTRGCAPSRPRRRAHRPGTPGARPACRGIQQRHRSRARWACRSRRSRTSSRILDKLQVADRTRAAL
jgi:DNA-binding NarL/FixJ family response regulator